jgi:uncharacterized repeat protein (TIGR01451 family)
MMSLVSFLYRIAYLRRSGSSKKTLRLEPLENRLLPSTATFTTTFSDFTSFTDKPLAASIPQFDTMGGTRMLESVEVISNIKVDSSVSGTVTNHSSTAATEEATVTNASISVTGTGFTSPLTATEATLLDTGALVCPGKTTMNIGPFSASLTNSSDVTLTGGALAAFTGTGNLNYTTSASADSVDQVTGGSNIVKHTTVSANGTATVEVIYTFVTNPALVTTASQAITLGTTAPTLSDSATLSGATNVGGTITFKLIGPGGFSLTHTDTVSGNGTYTAGITLPTTGQVAGTYTWSAHYSGDANHNSADDQGGLAEQTVVHKASPALVETPSVTSGTAGVTLSDSAVLSGGYFETGTITFTLTGPGGFSYTQTDTAHGNGTYTAGDTPIGGVPAGTYTWSAVYAGDGNNFTADDLKDVVVQSDVGQPSADLTITKIGGETVFSGDTVHFTIVVSNLGPATAQNVVVTDPLPDAAHLTWTTDAGTITNGVLTDNVGSLASGASVTIHVSAVTPAGYSATLNNTATTTSTNNNLQSINASATDIVLAPAPSSISGSVFLDPSQHGNFVPPDVGLPGVTITLTGVASGGTSVTATVVTDKNGNFTFTALEPGTYNLVETQPVNFIPGASFAGDLGGTASTDVISSITVQASQAGVNYRFTELSLTPQAISKEQLLSSSTMGQLMGPAGTGVATPTDPSTAGAGPGHSVVAGARSAHSPHVTISAEVGTSSSSNAILLADFLASNQIAAPPAIITAGGSTSLVQVPDASNNSVLDDFFAVPSQASGVYVGGS